MPATEARCEHCGETYTRAHANRKYCSKLCGMRAYHESRKAAGRSLNRTEYERTCAHCGRTWTTVKRDAKYCSQACISRATRNRLPKQPPTAVQCQWCHALHFSSKKYCTTECERSALADSARAQRSPLRVAIEAGDGQAVIAEIRAHCRIDANGCWVWTRRSRDGYGYVRIARKYHQVHRIVLEAKHGLPLGTQHAHHRCANSLCVNPDHLQPVTHRENVAEMMARQSYLARIAELEAALASVDPHHPALRVIAVA